jgi:hypothetical protein
MTTRANFVHDFLYELPGAEGKPLAGLGRVWYGPGVGQVFARSSWDRSATWLGFIAGPYTQSHAHRDQGSLLLYKEGWLAYDAMIESKSGIGQGEELHNLVRLDGLTQQGGTTARLAALHAGEGWLHVAADLLPAYGGDERVTQVARELVFLEPDCVVVLDRVTTARAVAQIWQLNAPVRPSVSGARATVKGAKHTLQVDRIAPAKAPTTVVDWTRDPDHTGGFRLETDLGGGAGRALHVLSIDGAVTSTAATDDGVTISFADGRTATVRFDDAGLGGTLTLDGETHALGEGVDPLPEFL